MKSQSLLYLRPVEAFEKPLASDPVLPLLGWRTIVLGALIWTVLVVVSIGVGATLGWIVFVMRHSL